MEKADKNTIGERLRTTRKSLGLTQKCLSEELGVPQSNISLYESGGLTPSLNFLVSYAKKYNLSIDYILGLSDYESSMDLRKLIIDHSISAKAGEQMVLEVINEELTGFIELFLKTL